MSAHLRALRAEEFDAWLAASTAAYIEGMVEHAGVDREGAKAKAARDVSAILPQGFDTSGHEFFILEADDGTQLGWLWVAETQRQGLRRGCVFDVFVSSQHRGRGYGRLLMKHAETVSRSRGLDRIELNVWGGNDVARRLYRSLGYEERAISMSKELG